MSTEDLILSFTYTLGAVWALGIAFNLVARYFASLLNKIFGW